MKIRWSISLPIAALLLSLGLFLIGVREYDAAHRTNPGVFYEGTSRYIPPAQVASYSINAPAYVLSVMIRRTYTRLFGWRQDWFHYGYIEYYVCVCLLWWWVGYAMDRRRRRRHPPTPDSSFQKVVGVVMIVWAVLVLVEGGQRFWLGDIGWLIPACSTLWAIELAAVATHRLIHKRAAIQ